MTGREAYKQWLAGDVWKRIRSEAIKKSGKRCSICGYRVEVNFHHLFYPRDWDDTKPDHLMPLCGQCHERLHWIGGRSIVRREADIECLREEIIDRLQAKNQNNERTIRMTDARVDEVLRRGVKCQY